MKTGTKNIIVNGTDDRESSVNQTELS